MKLGEIADRLQCHLDGDPEIEIQGVGAIEDATPGQLTFLANRRYRSAVSTTRASAIIVPKNEQDIPIPALRADDAYLAFAHAIEFFYKAPTYEPGLHPTAVISKSARIGTEAHIGPYCFVDDDVVIGRHAVLHSFVSIYRGACIGDDFFAHSHVAVRENCQIGNRVILQNGCVIGGDGFGFARRANGSWHKIQQSGSTVIGDDVEIQVNSAIDRATVGETVIKRGAKIDNLVQVGHACVVGEDTLLCGQVGLAGSSVIGNGCIMAGQSAAAGHLKIGDRAILTAQSAVSHDVPAGATYSGSPGLENKTWLRCVGVFNRLPDLQHEVRALEKEVARLRAAFKES
ncbi:MAG TPA: UDP-3-O-(3-hydroxymyristoyl)glucosamine N-acyltransferase [Candidatus Acidoferrales bacterium]|nr:UDP-3-O-(3-hydroxymyristoyl)glucosamine N-acyltransferase [Candidatus Acidoferrales bacterium]